MGAVRHRTRVLEDKAGDERRPQGHHELQAPELGLCLAPATLGRDMEGHPFPSPYSASQIWVLRAHAGPQMTSSEMLSIFGTSRCPA